MAIYSADCVFDCWAKRKNPIAMVQFISFWRGELTGTPRATPMKREGDTTYDCPGIAFT